MVELRSERAGRGEVTTPELRAELSTLVHEVLVREPRRLGESLEDLAVRLTAQVYVLLDDAEAQALPEPSAVGQYGERWDSAEGQWHVSRTAEGVDIWTHPTAPLQRAEVLELAAALRAAAYMDVEEQGQ